MGRIRYWAVLIALTFIAVASAACAVVLVMGLIYIATSSRSHANGTALVVGDLLLLGFSLVAGVMFAGWTFELAREGQP